MKKFQVITDSTSDLILEDRTKFDIDYARMVFTIEGKNYEASLDWEGIKASDYYNKMRSGARAITALVSAGEFERIFKKYLDQGLDILYVACSSKLSGSIGNAKLVLDELMEEYPDRKVLLLDSLRSNYGEGLMAIEAAKLANDGKDVVEVFNKLNDEKLCYQTFATVGSLKYLKLAGRVKAAAAFFGNIMGVKPIILGDASGANYAYKKVKGRKTSLDDLVATIKERNTGETVYVEHADCAADAQYVVEKVKEACPGVNVQVSVVGPIIGATVGPDTITVNFYGKKVDIVGEE